MSETISPTFTFVKDGVYYFSRRIPKELLRHYSSPRIAFSLRTRSARVAEAIRRHMRFGGKTVASQNLRIKSKIGLCLALDFGNGFIPVKAFSQGGLSHRSRRQVWMCGQ